MNNLGVAYGDDSCLMPLRGRNFDAWGIPKRVRDDGVRVRDDGVGVGMTVGKLT